MRLISISLWTVSLIPLFMGFHKMFAYKSYDPTEYPLLAESNVNSYVGGDAYNYIINGTYSTSYFVLFAALLLAGFMVEIVIAIKSERIVEIAANKEVFKQEHITEIEK